MAGADDIEDYLARFPELQDILPAAVRSTRHYFPDAELVLELYRDPEIEDEYLVLLVRSNRYDRETMERIRLAESAFIERLTGRNGWLQITTDFRKKADRDEL
ncbi:MAG: hypothetical protein KatS3mg076_0049 [Candidatus Binatia bacterium]|nr:MAG: hypothetical protein KatS3mg076_0049 [Candidatus Binatia bacterium]